MPLCTRYAMTVSRNPNQSLSLRNAKYESESEPYFSTRNRARSRDIGRNDVVRATTAGRNESHNTDSAMPMPIANNAGERNRSSRWGSDTCWSPNSRSDTAANA